jgi:hypothetical protein
MVSCSSAERGRQCQEITSSLAAVMSIRKRQLGPSNCAFGEKPFKTLLGTDGTSLSSVPFDLLPHAIRINREFYFGTNNSNFTNAVVKKPPFQA